MNFSVLNTLSPLLGEFTYMSRGNSSTAKKADIGDIPLMELTRENQIKEIFEGLKKLGLNQNALEKRANISQGSIRELRRGKRAMTADKWQKITNVIYKERKNSPVRTVINAELDGIPYRIILEKLL